MPALSQELDDRKQQLHALEVRHASIESERITGLQAWAAYHASCEFLKSSRVFTYLEGVNRDGVNALDLRDAANKVAHPSQDLLLVYSALKGTPVSLTSQMRSDLLKIYRLIFPSFRAKGMSYPMPILHRDQLPEIAKFPHEAIVEIIGDDVSGLIAAEQRADQEKLESEDLEF